MPDSTIVVPLTDEILVGEEGDGYIHSQDGTLTSLANGRFLVTWVRTDDTGSTVVFDQIYDAAGNAIGDLISTAGGNYNFQPSIGAFSDGGFVVVRRQSFWNHERRKLRECSAYLVGLIMLRVDCDASGALRTSSV